MPEAQELTKDEQNNLNALKQSHDYYATAIQVLTTRVQYFHEEFKGIDQTVAFLRHLRDQTLAAIHKIEPPKEDKKEAYEMDLSHVKNEKNPLEVVQ